MTTGMPSLPSPSRAPRGRRGLLAIGAVIVTAAVALSVWYLRGDREPSAPAPMVVTIADTLARAPVGVRVRVRVVNTTSVQGLAKRATNVLRAFGYDVVEFEGGKGAQAGTVIAVHTAHADWGARIQRAMGVGLIELQPDTSRMVDVSVFVGSDWQPPSQPLRP